MNFPLVLFYGFSAILVFSALRVITARNPVHAALFLVLSFFTASGLWLLLQAEFLAIVLVLVYVGAVMVLFLFVVMMLNIDTERLRTGFWKNLPTGLAIAMVMATELILVVLARGSETPFLPAAAAGVSNSRQLGTVLYTIYIFPFEVAAVLLLVAVVAAVALTHRSRRVGAYIDPAQQARVQPETRVKLSSGMQPVWFKAASPVDRGETTNREDSA